MATLSKLKQLEQTYRKIKRGKALIYVSWQGDNFGTCNGKEITLTEWEALRGKAIEPVEIVLQWQEGER